MENYYDYELGDWVTADSRFRAMADQPPFVDLYESFDLIAERTWELILGLLDAVDEGVAYLAGYARDGFVLRHGAEFVDRIEHEARTNPRFLSAVLEMEARGLAVVPGRDAAGGGVRAAVPLGRAVGIVAPRGPRVRDARPQGRDRGGARDG